MPPKTRAELQAENDVLRARLAELKGEPAGVVEALHARTRQLESVQMISAEIAREMRLPLLLELIIRHATWLVDGVNGSVLLWEEGTQRLLPAVWIGREPASRGTGVGLGEGLTGTVAARRTGLIVNDYRASPYARPVIVERTEITASMAEPLLYRERLVGVINMDNGETGRTFSAEHGELLRLFATQAAVAIENARLFAAAQRELAERARAEEALRRYHLLAERARDIVLFVRRDGRILEANRAAVAAYGYCREELLSLGVQDLRAPESRDGIAGQMTRANLEGILFETVHLRKDGTTFPVEVSSRGTVLEGEQVILSIVRDISERRRGEEERRKIETQMQHTQKLESLGVLAGGIAHDFNNLLVAILGHAELARLELPPVAPARAHLEEIETASHRAADLCKQMLAYAGKGHFVVEALDLTEMVREMSHILGVAISKKAALQYDLAARLPAIQGDATQIRQVIMNLITNASEALGEQPGIVRVTTASLRCDRASLQELALADDLAEGEYVTLEVSDTGCGMDEATRARIFDPFFSTKFAGRGLGLAAVLGIVRGHRGGIKLSSERGKGTTFRLLFPAGPDPARCERPAPSGSGEWRGRGLVLLVDDEAGVREVGQKLLEWLGFTVPTAADGLQALEMFRERAREIVCVLLDLTMPRMDGEETFRELRRLSPDARIVMSSGYNPQDFRQRVAGKRPAGFIQKPYRLEELRRTLRAALEGGTEPDRAPTEAPRP